LYRLPSQPGNFRIQLQILNAAYQSDVTIKQIMGQLAGCEKPQAIQANPSGSWARAKAWLSRTNVWWWHVYNSEFRSIPIPSGLNTKKMTGMFLRTLPLETKSSLKNI